MIRNHPTIYKAKCICPSIHLPMESYLMKNCKYSSCFLRTNPKSVVIGLGQLAQAECNLMKMKEDNIKLIRRSSGGGAVFLDEGNCMFGLFGSNNEKDGVTINKFNNILTKAINNTFGVNSIPTGKNDISVDGIKVAGLAYNKTKDKFLCHACILVDANTSLLPFYLTPNQKKIEANSVKSIEKRVINLKEFNKTKTREDLEKTIIEEFYKEYILNKFDLKLDDTIKNLLEKDMLNIEDVQKMNLYMNTDEYLYGKSFKYNMRMCHKFLWGFVEIYMDIDRNIIKNIIVNTDCLDITIPTIIKELLLNKNINEISPKKEQRQEINDIISMIKS
jgi:lipoate-protein ligase A